MSGQCGLQSGILWVGIFGKNFCKYTKNLSPPQPAWRPVLTDVSISLELTGSSCVLPVLDTQLNASHGVLGHAKPVPKTAHEVSGQYLFLTLTVPPANSVCPLDKHTMNHSSLIDYAN